MVGSELEASGLGDLVLDTGALGIEEAADLLLRGAHAR